MVTEVKKRVGFHLVIFSDGTELKVPEAMYYDFRVRAGDPVDREHYEKQLSDHAYEYALDRAARELLSSQDTVGAIADRNGFADEFYFSRIFKKYYRLAPRFYREEFQA